jgi:tRNA-splicing ligase RtcB
MKTMKGTRALIKAWTHGVAFDQAAIDQVKNVHEKVVLQSGTLGGGNHFIELCLDTGDRVWVMLHSGSRGIGNIIGRYFIEVAKEDMRVHHINLPDRDLSYLSEGTEHFDDYIQAVGWAQNYARSNRDTMMSRGKAREAHPGQPRRRDRRRGMSQG